MFCNFGAQLMRQTFNTYGHPQAFAVAGPSAWNSLPDPVRNPNSTEAAFRRQLKTFSKDFLA